jgi:ABC-type sugar transport system permease subunit
MVLPALVIVLGVAIVPLGWTVWESLHLHDLRMPWRGRPFVGLANYREILLAPRFWGGLGHTIVFAIGSVVPELVLGTILALGLDRAFRGRGLARAFVLVPWAMPTVVTALLWRFLFDDAAGPVNWLLVESGLATRPPVWLADPIAAWVPVILGDVWKTTPFVALLVLAGLQNIDPALHEAARMDGAGSWWRFRHVTLTLLRPALLVALIFRSVDAFRVFDLVYVLTGGGPGTATEPLGLYTFSALFQNLRFGYGAALGVVIFGLAFLLALLYIRSFGEGLTRGVE